MAMFQMQHEVLSQGVIDTLEREQRRFVWGEQEGTRKWHALSWGTMCSPRSCGGAGFKSLKHMNEAFCMKLAWRMIQEPSSLWVQVLEGKYGRGRRRWEEPKCQNTDSHLWKGIAKHWGKLYENLFVEINNGETTSVWYDKWLPNRSRLSLGNLEQLQGLKDLVIKDLFDALREGTLQEYAGWINTDVVSVVHRMIEAGDKEQRDRFRWGLSGNGEFSISSAYKLLRDERGTRSEGLWKNIWRLGVPERVRVFMWITTHNKLLTRRRTSQWGGGSDECPQCHQSGENQLHVLRDCQVASMLWKELLQPSLWTWFFELDWNNWLRANIRNVRRKELGSSWPNLFSTGCWFLWKWRNLSIHEEEFRMPNRPQAIVRNYLENYQNKWTSGEGNLVEARIEWVVWKTPEPGWCKLSTDGWAAANEVSGCGGVIRGDEGEWLRGFSFRTRSCDSYCAEAWGIWKGLEMCWSMGFRKVEVECDALDVVRDVNERIEGRNARSVFRHIVELLDRDWMVIITHVFREGNRCADTIANLCRDDRWKNMIWIEPPPEVATVLVEDQLGIPVPRLVQV